MFDATGWSGKGRICTAAGKDTSRMKSPCFVLAPDGIRLDLGVGMGWNDGTMVRPLRTETGSPGYEREVNKTNEYQFPADPLSLPDIYHLLRLGKSPMTAARLTLRAALLADTASQILTGALRGMAHFRGVELHLYEGEYDQIDLQVLNPQSDLYGAKPETVILYPSVEKFATQHAMTPPLERSGLASAFLSRVGKLHAALSAKGSQNNLLQLG